MWTAAGISERIFIFVSYFYLFVVYFLVRAQASKHTLINSPSDNSSLFYSIVFNYLVHLEEPELLEVIIKLMSILLYVHFMFSDRPNC